MASYMLGKHLSIQAASLVLIQIFLIKKKLKPGVVSHIFKSQHIDLCEFEANLFYIVSVKTARVCRETLSNKKY